MEKIDVEVLTYSGKKNITLYKSEKNNSTTPPRNPSAFAWSKNYSKEANEYLYAMLKTDDKILKTVDSNHPETDLGVSPHVIDMLVALNNLSFPIYGKRDVCTREGNARKIASDILPYAIASGNNANESNYLLDMEEALDMGNYMLNFYGYQVYHALVGYPDGRNMIINNADFLAGFIGSNSSRASDIKRLMDAVRENARRIMYDENYINMLSTYYHSLYDETNKDTHFRVASEVSLIYACSLMGDKNITKELFDLNLEDLKAYTTNVRKLFLDSNLGSFQPETTLTGKHFKH